MPTIRIPADATPEVKETFRQIQTILNRLVGERNVDHHGRRTINAGDAVDPQDYVTLRQAGEAISESASRVERHLTQTLTVHVNPAGAISGNGTISSPLAVRVDGSSIIINSDNQLEVADVVDLTVYYAPLTTGEEPLDFISDGGGSVVMVPFLP